MIFTVIGEDVEARFDTSIYQLPKEKINSNWINER